MPRLSSARASVLDHLADQREPCRVVSLAARLHHHPNTVREHLDALVRLGLVTREASEPRGRGRPPWLYSAVHRAAESANRPGARAHAVLASALAAYLARTSTTPLAEAIDTGASWGSQLIAVDTQGALAARRQVIQLLDDLGFAPEADDRATDVRLRHCPLLETVQQYPEVVCGVHLGLVRGALGALGADPERTSLEPFAEPGACRLRLLTARKP